MRPLPPSYKIRLFAMAFLRRIWKLRLLVIGLMLVVLLLLGLRQGRRIVATRSANAPVRYETVRKGDVDTKVTETGTIEPLKKVEVKSKVAGRVAKLYVQEGSHVQSGQLLVEIDPTEINSQVEQIRAQLDGAKARLSQAQGGVVYQVEQTHSGIRQSEEALNAARNRLRIAEEENRSQPGLTAGDVESARAGLKASQDALTLLKNSTQPQARTQAQSDFEDAKAGEDTARRSLERQKTLVAKGFVPQSTVEQSQSTLASARSRLEQAQKRLDLIDEQQRLEIADSESKVAQAGAALKRSLASQSQVAIKRQEALSARSALEQARAQLQGSQSGTQQDKIRREAVTEARAAVTQLQNQLNEVQVHQHDTRLMAGVSGVVTKRYVEEGELVTSGVNSFSSGTPILQIADLSRMLVKIGVNEVDVNKIKPELPVEVTIDGVRGAVFKGHIRTVSPAALTFGAASDSGQGNNGNNNVIRFAVEVVLDQPDLRLKPGMSARCNVIIARQRNVIRLPNDCVEGKGVTAKVQVLDPVAKDGKKTFTPRTVTVGLRGDTFTEIVSGLKPGERVKPGVFNGPKRKALDLD